MTTGYYRISWKGLPLKPLFLSSVFIALPLSSHAQLVTFSEETAQNFSVELAPDSPFRNPNIIYLEADEVIDNQDTGILTAKGSVNARYQDRTLSADELVYDITSGRVIALGNVVLTDASGSAQYADKIELSDQLESGSAKDFVARFPQGGIASAAYAVRRGDETIDLYSAYYTACEACENEDGTTKDPTWRIKARQVTQDTSDQMIHYKDAVFEFKGIPLFYTPYLAHPDPSSERRSGLLMPYAGSSGKYGVFYEQPYYWTISEYSDLTVTPRLMSKVNPLAQALYNKSFYSGPVQIEGSLTYGEWFDGSGDTFTNSDIFLDPAEDLSGESWRGHLFSYGQFDLSENWMWGFGIEGASDDLYLERYDIDEPTGEFGFFNGGSRRLTQQLYAVRQDDVSRYAASTYGFDSLRSTVTRGLVNTSLITVDRELDASLPTVLPKIEIDHYFKDPIAGGRVHAFGDATVLTRSVGDDYSRFSAGLEWSKSVIAAGGIELKPFANIRADHFNLEAEDQTVEDREFSRSLGQAGLDARWTFVRPGEHVNMTLEPRVLLTQNFGDGKIDAFSYNGTQSAREDGLGLDLNQALLWNPNKAAGYDLWQEGFRADIGASLAADWDLNRASLFLGQSFASNTETVFQASSGIAEDVSDLIGQFDLTMSNTLSTSTRIRYDDEEGTLRRVDSNVDYTGEKLSVSGRYYKLDELASVLDGLEDDIPPEELSGHIQYRVADNWSVGYTGYRDMENSITRREELALSYDDDCTLIEMFYERDRRSGISGGSSGFGVRISLLTLGGEPDR